MLPVLAVLVVPTVAPSPSALPEIGRVRSTYVCSILRRRVDPAIVRLTQADGGIERGKRAFVDMGRDEAGHLKAASQTTMGCSRKQ